jgi:thiol-disulfide isomerase/thioredoxin
MNARTQTLDNVFSRLDSIPAVSALLVLTAALAGCDRSSDSPTKSDSAVPPYAASTPATAPDATPLRPGPSETSNDPSAPSGQNAVAAPDASQPDPESAPTAELAMTPPPLDLKKDLSAEMLIAFLAEVDAEIQETWAGRSGITERERLQTELQRIVRLKLEASRRLMDHPDASDEVRIQGARGELQSLSHLSVLGDLESAEALELLAKKQIESADKRLAADSRLVLIGFAVEALQSGSEQAPEEIVTLIKGFAATTPKSSDFPALMAMGQARQMLSQYGYDEQATIVRDVIIELFAGSPDPNVAELTAQIAGNVKYEQIDQMLLSVLDSESISADQWQTAVETLIAESADLQTVQYLAGAALEFESLGKEELVVATLQSLANHFDDPDSATGREVELAIGAREARQQVIGRSFDPDLPGVGESAPKMEDYRGKVVLMPFWATGFPDSLQLIEQLRAICDDSPDEVVIVGMNLDVADAPIKQFMQSRNLQFDSFHAESSPTAKIANPVAAQFGMVSMPFLIIIDRQGRVAAIKLTGRDLETTVDDLIANQP